MQEAVQNSVSSAVEETLSELGHPRWSVISFERCEASGISYSDAQARMDEFDRRGAAGLRIVSDEAAARLKN